MHAQSDIRVAAADDLDKIMRIFQEATRAMLAAGIDQWDGSYPVRERVAADIQLGDVFVMDLDGLPAATITLNARQDAQYREIGWNYRRDPVLVIHRLAVVPAAQGRGLGRQLCLFAEHYARQRGFKVIRLDAYSGNPVSNQLYKGLGYVRAHGFCWFHGNQLPFLCYEKPIG